jgi:hypothetical protein
MNGTEDCAENLLTNGRFTSTVASWVGNISWSSFDGNFSSSSGSGQIVNDILNDPAASAVFAAQCIPVHPSTLYKAAGMVSSPPTGVAGNPEVRITPYTDASCNSGAGAPTSSIWATPPGAGWTIRSSTFTTPAGANSVLVELRATKPAMSANYFVNWDNLVVHP